MGQYVDTGIECAVCEEGTIVKGRIGRHCNTCFVTMYGHKKDHSRDVWKEFEKTRPTYPNSGKKKCVGGFLGPYNWGESDAGAFKY